MKCVALLVLCSVWLTVCARYSHSRSRVEYTTTQTPCTPKHDPRVCDNSESVLLSEVSTPLTEADGFGPNVCRITRTYAVKTFAYMTTHRRRCWGYRCVSSTYCSRTSDCTGQSNITRMEIDCCEGFAVDPNPAEGVSATSSSWYRRKSSKHNTLRNTGCTLMLVDSVTECLLELGLDSFTNQLLSEASDQLIDELGNGDNRNSYTVFGSSEETADLLAYIVNGTVEGKQLSHGKVLQTLAPDVLLHVGKVSERVYINGVRIAQLNACQARNGIVHSVADSTIPYSNLTIAARLREDPRFSTFLRLLDGANITRLLDVAEGKSRTLLAPTNEAFDKLPENTVECLLSRENLESLSQLVLIHIGSPAEYNSTLSQRSRFYTFNTRYFLFVRVENGEVLVTNSRIPFEEADIPANNGVIHALPEVVLPPEVDLDKLNCPTPSSPTDSAVGALPEVIGD